MANEKINSVKLGAFVLAGLILMILALFIIGKNKNLFGNEFQLKAKFSNLNGLTTGNNVLFSGFQAGTVKDIELLNDSTIEVTMQINDKVKDFIGKNALASIGTEGLMGNKVINISPMTGTSAKVEEGDVLQAKNMANMDEIIDKLSQTNNNVATISEVLKGTVMKVDSSAILKLINDETIGESLKASLLNIYTTTKYAQDLSLDLNHVVKDIRNGKGAAGLLLTDTSISADLKNAVQQTKMATTNANAMSLELNAIVKSMNYDLNHGNNTVNTILKDSVMARNVRQTMDNLQKGTDGFNQNMEALKHNFFFRGFFKAQERQKNKEEKLSGRQR
jgi:phospholipid/cholesterol/gamma-HCH transport system substrate-binding protein